MRTPFQPKTFFRQLPRNVAYDDAPYFENIRTYKCPALNLYRFQSVSLLPDGTLFRGIFPLSLSFPFFRKRLRHHNVKGIFHIRLNWKRKTLKASNPFLIIHDPWTQNYYHWMTQAVVRLLLAQQVNESFTLLLPEDHQSEFHLSTLKLLGVTNWIVIERDKSYFQLENVIYPTHDIQIGDYHDDLMKLLSERFRVNRIKDCRRLVFIRRKSQDKRRILNEEDVTNTFRSFDFEVIAFEELTFGQQLELASEARVLAGVHGAGLTNMLFMPPDSTVFELTTKVNGEHYYYYALSNALSHRYFYQVCETDREAVVQDANLIVDIPKLKENLSLIVSQL